MGKPVELQYRAEWRLVDAGKVYLKWLPGQAKAGQLNVHLETLGLVNKLVRVKDDYSANLDERGCTMSTLLRAEENARKKETLVTFDRNRKKAEYIEKDLIKNTTINKETEIPGCAFDVIGGLMELRRQKLEPGAVLSMPISDGKKFVNARIEVQGRELVKTPLGDFNAIKVEALLFDGVIYARKARLHLWFSDDAERLPLQIRIAMRFYIGNVILVLEKKT